MEAEDVRLSVYRTFAETGRAPTADELTAQLACSVDEVREALEALAAARHLVVDESGAIAMAHPFSAIPLGFSVMGARSLWWGGCAWDSFALPHLLMDEPPMLVATRCPACGTAHAWEVGRSGPPAGEQVAHFLVPAARMWDDVVHACGNLASHWYDGRLDRGYARRDPAESASYLEEVGLRGAFWGLPD